MIRILAVSLFLFAPVFLVSSGCGGSDDGVTVTGVDDSVVHSEEQMKSMEEANAADMGQSN